MLEHVSGGQASLARERRERIARASRIRTFYVGMSAVILAIVLTGFTPTFFLRSYLWPRPDEYFTRHGPELPAHLVVHGIVLTGWFTLALVQACLVATHRTRLHRRLGVAGIVLAVGVVLTGIVAVVLRDAPRIDEVSAFRPAGNLITLVGFALCFTAAILLRKRPADHKRLMTIASIWAVGAAVTRLVISVALTTSLFSTDRASTFSFALVVFLLLTVVVRDLVTERRLLRGTVLGLTSIAVAIGFTLALIRVGAWEAFVRLFG